MWSSNPVFIDTQGDLPQPTPLLSCYLLIQRCKEWLDGSLHLEFNRIIFVLASGSTFSTGNMTSRLVENKITGIGSKYFASGWLDVIVRSATLILPFHFCICECWLPDKQHHILDIDSEHVEPLRAPSPSSARYWHLTGTITES